ncbi:hypothetical protein A3746_06420 [Oleibacter sp. HI0075]|nr:hypothetical protein A3746_06420 [Oleibacter sp. HI0075]
MFWLQSGALTIDLRLPLEYEQQAEPENKADYEGWYAHSVWQHNLLDWQGGVSSLSENRWPEPAELRRVGNCMMEFAPSGAYVEDWRLLNSVPGLFVGLELIGEEDLTTGARRELQGALILAGDYMGAVLNRSAEEFITDIGELEGDEFVVRHSRDIHRTGKLMFSALFEADDGEFFYDTSQPEQIRLVAGQKSWSFRIDTLVGDFHFAPGTSQSESAERWFKQFQSTLGRYLRRVV